MSATEEVPSRLGNARILRTLRYGKAIKPRLSKLATLPHRRQRPQRVWEKQSAGRKSLILADTFVPPAADAEPVNVSGYMMTD